MQYVIRLAAIIAFSLTCASAQPTEGKKDRALRFSGHAVTKISNEHVKQPRVPKHWDEDLRLRVLDAVGTRSRTNFAGRYFVVVWSCGSACVSGAIIEPRTGTMHPLGSISSWNEVHDNFKGIDFRHNSRLIVLSGQRDEKPADMGQHFYVFENGKVRFLKTIKSTGDFMTPIK